MSKENTLEFGSWEIGSPCHYIDNLFSRFPWGIGIVFVARKYEK